VQVHSYDNPTNSCAGCGQDRGCCDAFNDSGEECVGFKRCDNLFFYCVRPLGTPTQTEQTISEDIESTIHIRMRELQCMQAFRSHFSLDGQSMNFSEPLLLGIPNPLKFSVESKEWQVSKVVDYHIHSVHIPEHKHAGVK
jgi:hypothetical protein